MNLKALKLLGITDKDIQSMQELFNMYLELYKDIKEIKEFIDFKKIECEEFREYKRIREKINNKEKLTDEEKEIIKVFQERGGKI